jgi:hypothetical protein
VPPYRDRAAVGGDETEDHRHRLVVGEHQRRQLEAGAQPIATVPAAVGGDRDAELGQGAGIPPDGPFVDAEARGEVGAGEPVVGLEQLEQGEDAGGGMGHAPFSSLIRTEVARYWF